MVALPFSHASFAAPPTTRFAPSPNGRLHLGHAYSALMAHDVARLHPQGRYLVRIEDIDGTRSRTEHVEAILADLEWLGLADDAPPLFQSSRIAAYADALGRLRDQGLVYRCFCTRGDIVRALASKSVRHGPDGPAYPGTCRALSAEQSEARAASGETFAWRLRMDAGIARVGGPGWHEAGEGQVTADTAAFGDVVLWRKDAPASYHLAVVLDDAMQRIDPVVRGRDLYAYTAVHRLLQALLDLPTPVYWHHGLLVGADGEKLAKSARSPALSTLRQGGADPAALLAALRLGKMPTGISLAVP